MHLYIFNDPHGFILNLTVSRLTEMDALGQYGFINLTSTTIYKNEKVQYVERSIPAFRRVAKRLPSIEKISLCPLDFTSVFFLKEVRLLFPDVAINWLFWSYEYYNRPDLYLDNLGPFSLEYFRRDGWHNSGIMASFKGIIKKALGKPVFDAALLDESYRQVSAFYSFLPSDYDNVFPAGTSCPPVYRPFSFISISEILAGIEEDLPARENEIMIGHSASLTGNHAEMIDRLASMNISNRFFIPLEYGEKRYSTKIKDMAIQKLGKGRVVFLEQRLDMQAYYRRIATCGYAVFNFRWQEALGNILFLLWNGAKVFLQRESSVYRQFRQWGVRVFAIETEIDENNLTNLLSQEETIENRRIIEDLFSEDRINGYWQSLR